MTKLIATAAALVLLLAPAANAATERTSLPDIEDEVMCPTCGVPLAEAFSPQAERERQFIRRLVAQGKTKDEIKDALVAEFGHRVLATPRKQGFELTAYIVPIVVVLLAAIAIVVGLLHWRRRDRDDDAPPATKITGSDATRLEQDLARFDP